MADNIMAKGKGVIEKVALYSVNSFDSFAKRANKKLFIDVLKEETDQNVCLIAYCVIDGSAHFLVKGNSTGDIRNYAERVENSFDAAYEAKGPLASPLRADKVMQRISPDDLKDAIIYIHSLAPDGPENYPFCSYEYLLSGTAGGTAVIMTESGGEMSRAEYRGWLERSAERRYKTPRPKEKFRSVLNDVAEKYLSVPPVPESAAVCSLSELCTRSGAGFGRAARALNFSCRKRKDLLVSTLCDLIDRLEYDYYEAMDILKIPAKRRKDLFVDCVVELNRTKSYSYEYIMKLLNIKDTYYDVLTEIMRELHRKYRYGFEELCVKYHILEDILLIRSKCGF